MIGIPSEVEGAAVIVYAVVGAHGEASHALGLVIIHVEIADAVRERDQPSVSVEGVVAVLGRRISARHQEVEVLNLIEGPGSRRAGLLLGHDGL